jgi:hypothetical protein
MMNHDLLQPSKLYTRAEVLARPTPAPAAAGVYAWYFDVAPGPVPFDEAHQWKGQRLLYVGIAPRKPPSGKPPGNRTLAARLREHFNLNAEGSTLRLTLGCLLGIELRRIASQKHPGTARRMTFGPEGERQLNAWMATHARVVWHECVEPWALEHQVLKALPLPLNLDANSHSSFHAHLTALRADAKARARLLPPLLA